MRKMDGFSWILLADALHIFTEFEQKFKKFVRLCRYEDLVSNIKFCY